ncbi:DUF3386 domain-containing protein [Mastigocoleus testarum]|uniref:DUF3386 domain-containing protein n=1 Tax=Mastigocoleus testarum BC008 TaxID=371196 RepID=A0A0V7ZK52_9CYAN|nr:DUF3386 domain-containing protein [Mastigocoleus testarum]KST64934.1 hypothetical protein BC008_19175 [Mastigocoleus testarum BC008]KST65017.1 hypothetical protein BC008_19640 [Mastigocoleus testarum BC008]
MTTQITGRELFQTAYESRYTWNEKFPGYSADVKLMQGAEVCTGKIRINRDLTVEVTEVPNEEVKAGIYTQLRDLVNHRQPTSFEESYGQYEFSLGQTDDDGGVEVFVSGDSTSSTYKIRNKEVVCVTRVMGKTVFVIDTHQSLDTGCGYVATHYSAIFRDSKTDEIKSILKFEDTYEKIGDYYLMTKQVITENIAGEDNATEFSYPNIKLMEAASV